MRKNGRIRILFVLLLILVSGTVSYAAISKPKNFRVVYMSDKGTVLESFEWSVYAVQQVFLDKLSVKTYIDPKGYEYNVTGYRLQTWSGANFTGTASDDVATSYSGIVSVLRRAYDTLDPPYSLQATLVMKATGNKYSADIPVRVIWLNQNNEFVKEETQTLGRDNSYTDKPPKEYEILSVDAMMTDIWNVGSEITIDPKAPTVRYSKFAGEYRIVYRLNLTPEQEAEIIGLAQESGEEESSSAGSESSGAGETAESPAKTTAEGAKASDTAPPETAPQESAAENSMSSPEMTETVVVPSQTDESFKNGSGRTTLILGLVIGIAVIYLIVITIGTNSRGKKSGRKKDFRL